MSDDPGRSVQLRALPAAAQDSHEPVDDTDRDEADEFYAWQLERQKDQAPA